MTKRRDVELDENPSLGLMCGEFNTKKMGQRRRADPTRDKQSRCRATRLSGNEFFWCCSRVQRESLSLRGQQLSLTWSSDLFRVVMVLIISARGAQRQQTVIENQTVAFLGRLTQKRPAEWDLQDGSKSEGPAHSAISTKSAAWDFPSRFRCRSNHEDSKPKASPSPPVKRPVHDGAPGLFLKYASFQYSLE